MKFLRKEFVYNWNCGNSRGKEYYKKGTIFAVMDVDTEHESYRLKNVESNFIDGKINCLTNPVVEIRVHNLGYQVMMSVKYETEEECEQFEKMFQKKKKEAREQFKNHVMKLIERI